MTGTPLERGITGLGILRLVVPVLLLVLVARDWNGIPGQPFRDSLAYHDAAESVRADRDIYAAEPAAGPHRFRGHWPYLYPPPLAALLAFTPRVSYREFDRIWMVLGVAGFWIFAVALSRLAGTGARPRSILNWGIALFFSVGSLLAIHFGNVEPLIWALVGAAFAMPVAAGAALTMAAAVKITPAWPLLVLGLRAPRRIIPPAAVTAAALFGVTWYALGSAAPEAYATWANEVLPELGQGQFLALSWEEFRSGFGPLMLMQNLSLTFVPIQVAALLGWNPGGGDLPTFVRLYLTVASVAVPSFVAWRTRERPALEQAAWVFAAASFAAPIARPYALPYLLLPLALARGRRAARRPAADEAPGPGPGFRAIAEDPSAPG